MDSVGSTSWHNRHIAAFRRLGELLRETGAKRPSVMIVGPGGVTRLFAPLLNDSDRARGPLRKWVGDAARYADQLTRRIPLLPLRSLEPIELSRTLSAEHDLIVVDRSRRVLAAVSRDLPRATTHCVDISAGPIPASADAVIAFNVVCRLDVSAQREGMAHVAAAVRMGGWLLMDDRSARAHLGAHAEFQPVCEKTYRRIGAPVAESVTTTARLHV